MNDSLTQTNSSLDIVAARATQSGFWLRGKYKIERQSGEKDFYISKTYHLDLRRGGILNLASLKLITGPQRNVGMTEKLAHWSWRFPASCSLLDRVTRSRISTSRLHDEFARHAGASGSRFESVDYFDVSKAISIEYPRPPMRLLSWPRSSRLFSPIQSDQWTKQSRPNVELGKLFRCTIHFGFFVCPNVFVCYYTIALLTNIRVFESMNARMNVTRYWLLWC